MTCRRRRDEAGTTLVEVLVTVMVLGVAFVAILGGMGTLFASSALHREQARVEVEVRRYAEAVKATAYANSYAGVFTAGANFSVQPPVVLHCIDDTTGANVACDATPRAQVIRLTASSTRDSRAEETVDVVKRPT